VTSAQDVADLPLATDGPVALRDADDPGHRRDEGDRGGPAGPVPGPAVASAQRHLLRDAEPGRTR